MPRRVAPVLVDLWRPGADRLLLLRRRSRPALRAHLCPCAGPGTCGGVVDTPPVFTGLAGDTENVSGAALQAMQPLQPAADGGLGVLIVRHNPARRRRGRRVGARLDRLQGRRGHRAALDQVRRENMREQSDIGRFDGVPDGLVIELVEDEYGKASGSCARASRIS